MEREARRGVGVRVAVVVFALGAVTAAVLWAQGRYAGEATPPAPANTPAPVAVDDASDGLAPSGDEERRVFIPSSKALLPPDLGLPLDPDPPAQGDDAEPERRVFIPSSKLLLAPNLAPPAGQPDEGRR